MYVNYRLDDFEDLLDVIDSVYYKVIAQIFLFSFNRQFTYNQLTQNHHDLLSVQLRNPVDSRFWTRLCYYCSKRDLNQKITISSQEIPLAAWHLLLSQRQDFLNNHLQLLPTKREHLK